MKFKVGDKVKIREDLEHGDRRGKFFVTVEMAESKGKYAKITGVHSESYALDILPSTIWWTDEMLEEVDVEKRLKELERRVQEADEILSELLQDLTDEEIIKPDSYYKQGWVGEGEPKFYLKAKGTVEGKGFLNKKNRGHLWLDNEHEFDNINKTRFTESEIQDLPEWCQHLERIPIND